MPPDVRKVSDLPKDSQILLGAVPWNHFGAEPRQYFFCLPEGQ